MRIATCAPTLPSQASKLDDAFAMSPRTIQIWLPLGGIVIAAWVFVALMSLELARVVSAGALGPGMSIFDALADNLTFSVGNICRPLTEAELRDGGWGPFSRVVLMWSAMSIAMMLPTAIPLIATYVDFSIGNREKVPKRQVWALICGYLVVWFGFSILMAWLQLSLSRAVVLDGTLVNQWPWLSALFLLLAGLYQFSALKETCLSKCRSPFSTFMGMWRDGVGGAFTMGARQGLYCLGCCWALMLLAFVGGVMNIVWMACAMVIMLLEKLPSIGARLTTPVAVLLIGLSGYMAVQALF